jgi:triacylglycerol esterase/lipase EstA (alpha/beta hydrolase family)
MRSFAFVLGLSLAACSAAPPDESSTTGETSDELLSCGWLNGGGCSFLPSGNWRTPEFWGDVYLAKFASQRKYALEHIEAGPKPLERPRAVLLITGVTIKAEWFDPIVARLKRDGFEPVVYEPPALLSGSLFKESADLGKVIDKVRADSGQEKIDILAECTGGVIARHYIQSLGGASKVSRMVTFVSPQHGIAMAPLVYKIVGWPALHDLSPGSAFLHAVNDVPLPSSVKFTSIYTCTDLYIQPWTSSVIPGATNIGVACSKGYIDHFQTMYDPEIYMIMHDALVAE